MDITLDMLRTDKLAVVTAVDTDDHMTKRLQDYGLVPGTVVRCRYRTPDGSVTALEFRGSVLAVRTVQLRRIRGCGLWKP